MRNRILLAAGTVAVFVPALLLAQQSMSGGHREQTWELSAGVGVFGVGQGFTGGLSSSQFMPGGMLRVGYNLTPMWNISVGTGLGYGKSWLTKTSTNTTGYATPSALVTWTPDINKVTSPFVDAGVGLLYRKNPSNNNTGAGVQVGVGVRHMLADALALRVEGGVMVGSVNSNTTGAGYATVGVSYFLGGRAAVASVAVAPRMASLNALGATQQLTGTPMDKNGKMLEGRVVTWSSSNPSVATVSPAGMVTARSNGSATITATSETGSGSTNVTVAQVAATLAVTPSTGSLSAFGQTQQFAVSARDANNNAMTGAPITWSSSDPTVATVSSSGVATAVGNGTARITATSGRHSAAATLAVAQTTASVAVTPPSSVLSAAGATVQLSAQASDANGQTIANKTFTWTSDATGVATVSDAGVVTAVANGVAHISAAADGQSGTALVSVVVAPKGAPPVALPTLPSEANGTLVLKNVNFRVGSSVLLPAAKAELDRIAIAIQGVPNAKWEIGGYTSSLGRAATNLRLSRLRANAVRAYLISKGVAASNLTAVGYGATHFVATNRTRAGRDQNMRVEIKRLP